MVFLRNTGHLSNLKEKRIQGSRDFLKHFIIGMPSPDFPVFSGNLRKSNNISCITEVFLDLGFIFNAAVEFLSSPCFFFCRRAKPVPGSEEVDPRQREASLGNSNESRDREGGHKNERG